MKVKLASNMVWDADKELVIKGDVTMAVGQAAMGAGEGEAGAEEEEKEEEEEGEEGGEYHRP